MASKNINELFQSQQNYNDIDLSFTVNPITRDINRLGSLDSIKQSVSNLLQLNVYDIEFHPEIAANVRGLLFELESSDAVAGLAKSLQRYLGRYEPRIQVQTINIDTSGIDNNAIGIQVSYIVVGRIQQVVQTVTMNRVR